VSYAQGLPCRSQMQRIAVVGTGGSGKTTLATRLGETLGVLHVELDELHWGPDWAPAPLDAFRERTSEALAGLAWVVDGNYSKVRDIIWSRADTVVWLDYPLPIVMARLTYRTLKRAITRKELWAGNRERFWMHLFSRDSFFLYVLRDYGRRQREYPELLAQPEHAHIGVIRFHRPRAARNWLDSLAQ